MSHAGTAIAGNLGLCRLRCLWRWIPAVPALRPRKPELGHLGASQRCYGMLYGLGWARSAAGYCNRSHVSDATQIGWQLLTASHAGANGTLLAQKVSWKLLEILKLHQFFLNPELFVNQSTIKIDIIESSISFCSFLNTKLTSVECMPCPMATWKLVGIPSVTGFGSKNVDTMGYKRAIWLGKIWILRWSKL